MPYKVRARRASLFKAPGGLITTDDVSLLMGIRVVTARAYKKLDIICPYTTNGRADLYDLDEIRWTLKRLRALRPQRKLREISPIIRTERQERRAQNPIEYAEPIEEQIISESRKTREELWHEKHPSVRSRH